MKASQRLTQDDVTYTVYPDHTYKAIAVVVEAMQSMQGAELQALVQTLE